MGLLNSRNKNVKGSTEIGGSIADFTRRILEERAKSTPSGQVAGAKDTRNVDMGILSDAQAGGIGLETDDAKLRSSIPRTSSGGYPTNLREAMAGASVSNTPASYAGRTVAGQQAGSSGGFYGSAGRNTLGTDAAGNSILGSLGGRNVIGGRADLDRSAGVPQDPLAQYMQYLSPQATIDRQKTAKRDLERERRGQLDAIKDKYKARVADEQAVGAEDLSRQRSMNLRAGLGGSDFGVANKAVVRDKTRQNVQTIEANQEIEIGNALNAIEQLAQQRAQIEQTGLQQGFANTLQFQQQQQIQRDTAVESIKTLGKAGIGLADLKERDMQAYEQLVSGSGMSDVEIESVLNNAKPAEEQIDYTHKIYGGKLVSFGIDPKTGKQVMLEQDIDIPDGFELTTMPDGTLLAVPAELTADNMGDIQRVGNYAKPVSAGSTGPSNQQIDNERAAFAQFRGEPIVKNYNTVLNKQMTVASIVDSGMGGPGDLALVFEFMKALDPTSVVRESEYAAAAKSGNIFSGIWTRFNKGYFDPNGGILPEAVKQEFKALVNKKMDIAQSQYDNLAEQYKGIAERQQLNPENIVLDYAGVRQTSTTLTSPDGIEEVTVADLTEEQLQEAKDAGWL